MELISYTDGFSAVKKLCAALDKALSENQPLEIHVKLSTETKPVGFDEYILTSDCLRETLQMLQPCLRNRPDIRVEQSEG